MKTCWCHLSQSTRPLSKARSLAPRSMLWSRRLNVGGVGLDPVPWNSIFLVKMVWSFFDHDLIDMFDWHLDLFGSFPPLMLRPWFQAAVSWLREHGKSFQLTELATALLHIGMEILKQRCVRVCLEPLPVNVGRQKFNTSKYIKQHYSNVYLAGLYWNGDIQKAFMNS